MRGGFIGCLPMVVVALVLGVSEGPGNRTALGQTLVGGVIEEDTTWTRADSPYLASETVELVGGAVLTIEPGVEVAFERGAALDAGEGVLIADGLGGDTIVLRSASGAVGDWPGVITSFEVSAATTPEGDYVGGPIFRNVRLSEASRGIDGSRPVYFEGVTIERCGEFGVRMRLPSPDATTWLKGVTIRRAQLGITMPQAERVVIVDGLFEDNDLGGVRLFRGGGDLTRCTFLRRGPQQGGAWLEGDWVVRACHFEDNEATGVSRFGGGLRVENGRASVLDCVFIANTAHFTGGGADVTDAGTARVEGCRFIDNASRTSSGAGLRVFSSSTSSLDASIIECTFEGNRGDLNGALIVGATTGVIEASTFRGNTAVRGGGALRIINEVIDFEVRDNTFAANASDAIGGAIDLGDYGGRRGSARGLRIVDNAFWDNTADAGGAIGGAGPDGLTIAGNTFERNLARLGGAVHVRENALGSVSLAADGARRNRFTDNLADLGANIHNDSADNVNATGNCWGTDDPTEIADSIFDAIDDPARGLVAFDPIATGCDACPADLDADGELTIFDFLMFQNLFDLMDPAADFDGDGELTIFDFLAFQNAFDAGC